MSPIEASIGGKRVWRSGSGVDKAMVRQGGSELEITYMGDEYGGYGVKENGEFLDSGGLGRVGAIVRIAVNTRLVEHPEGEQPASFVSDYLKLERVEAGER